MGQSKASKNGDNVPQRHLHSRISFLHQGAAYLATNAPLPHTVAIEKDKQKPAGPLAARNSRQCAQAQLILNQLRGVAKKSQIRLAKDIKHSLCKRCNSLLITGQTSAEEMKNESYEGSKPWADVLEVKCKACGTVKRFPTGQRRPQKEKTMKPAASRKRKRSKPGRRGNRMRRLSTTPVITKRPYTSVKIPSIS